MSVDDGILANKLQFYQLKKFVGIRDALECCAEVFKRLLMANCKKGGESIALACGVIFSFKERVDEIWRIRDEGLEILIDGRNGPNGALPHIGMSVLEARASRGKKGFKEFGFAELAEESEGVASDVFIRMLEVVPDTVAVETYQSRPSMCLDHPPTRPGSFPASTSHWHPTSGISHSRSIAASSRLCSSTA